MPEGSDLWTRSARATLIIAVFNGAIYGIIAWLIYTIADRARKSKPQKQQRSQ